MRAEAMAADPDAAEFYGFEPPQAAAGKTESEKSESEKAQSDPAEAGDGGVDGLASEIEKAMQHPQVRQAIEEKIGEAEKTRQSYLSGWPLQLRSRRRALSSRFPELASIAPENLPGALRLMSRQDPAKFARVRGSDRSYGTNVCSRRKRAAVRPRWCDKTFIATQGRRTRASKPC